MGAVTHGMTNTPIYNSWRGMIERCTNPRHKAWHNYGGRGITVCEAWRVFDGFHADMGPSWQLGLTIDRLDNDGDYEPGNCAWRTYKQQRLNSRRINVIDTPWGRMTLGEAAYRSGLHRTTIHSRLKAGAANPFSKQHGNCKSEEGHGL